MTIQEILECIQEGNFSVPELESISRLADQEKRSLLLSQKEYWRNCDPKELLPDWGMYTASKDCSMPKRILDEAGIQLIKSIRNNDSDQCITVLNTIRQLQQQFAQYGADDTEGREALWKLLTKACHGTPINAEFVWDQVENY